jgi:hypothetical protein
MPGAWGLYTKERQIMKDDVTHYVYKYYRWNKTRRQYELKGSSKIEERTLEEERY